MSLKNHYIVCSIAGSDPMGGAGVQGDLKTFAAHGVEGTAVITAVTVQGPDGVEQVSPVPPDLVGSQLGAVLRLARPAAVKTGMLWSAAIADAVGGTLEDAHDRPLLVVDPVTAASAGGRLSQSDLVPALRDRVIPLATVVTPNWQEAALLLGMEAFRADDAEAVARALLELGAGAVVLKGGDTNLDPVVDLVVTKAGVERLALPRVVGASPHGTGCAFASALAARLAQGAPVTDAARLAKQYVHAAIEAAVTRGTPARLVHDVPVASMPLTDGWGSAEERPG